VSADDRSAVLVIRLWLEEGVEDEPLRARITRTLDTSAPRSVEGAARSEAEIMAAVQDWVRAFVAGP
jgi:hypothetical protein